MDKNEWHSYALLLKKEMKIQGLNQSELAEKAGLNRSTIGRFFELQFCPKLDTVIAVAKALDLELNIKKIK